MPPDGYETLTVSTELYDRLGKAVNPKMSRPETLRELLRAYNKDRRVDVTETKETLKAIEERTGRIEQQLEQLGGR